MKIWNTEVRSMKGKVKYADLGLLYDLIPHINFVTNTICANPCEADPSKIMKLNQQEICKLLDISKPTFSRLLNIKYDGKAVFAQVKVCNEKFYLVNPSVLYRLEKKPNDSLLGVEVDPFQPDKTLVAIFSSRDDEEKSKIIRTK